MRLSKFSKKWIAYICAIAMVVSSFAFTPSTDVNAAQSETIDGITYTVTDGAQGDWTGIVTQGIFDKARIHWAWGKAVDASSISITVNGVEVAAMGTNANGVHTTIAEVKDAVDSQMGEYTIKLTAVSTNEEQLEWTASLKMEEAAPTTTGEPGVITWVDVPASDGLQYDDSTNAKVINVQSPPWSEGKTGVYVEPPSGAGAPTAVKIDGTAYTANQGDNGAFFIQGAGILYYLDTFANETTTIEVSYAPNVESTLVIKNTKVSPTEETSVEPTTEEPTTEEPTTEEPTTEEPTTEAPTVAPKPQDYYDAWVDTNRNLAPLGTASDKGTHREGSVAAINDTVINSWNNWDAISIEGAITHGSFDIELDKAYDAASIDQVVVYWRTADVQFVPQAGYTVQFGYKGTFTTVATVSKSDYPTEGTVGGWEDDSRFVTDSDFTASRLPSSGVDTVRILVDTPVEWGAQVREVCVFSENPQDAPALPQADQPASVQGNSPDYGTIAFSVTPGEDQDGYKYNVYAGDTLIGEGVDGNQDYVAYGFNPGDYTLSAVSVVEGMDPSEPVYSDAITVADPLELFSSPKNKAVGGTITAVSSFYNDNYTLESSQCAIDGTPAAGEGADVCLRTGANQKASIDIDLGQEYAAKDLKKILLAYTNPRTYAASTAVGISNDGEDYELAAQSSGFTPTKDGQLSVNLLDADLDADAPFRYVRIVLEKGVSGWGYVVNQVGVIIDDSEEPTTEEPSTEEPTTEAPTVEPSTETPTGSGYNMHRLDYDTWTSLGGVFYAFTASGNGAQVDVGYDASINKAKTTQISGGNWWTWNTQVAAVYPQYTDDVKAGKEYKIKWHIATEDGASGNVVITTETGEANPVDFSSGDLTLEGKLVYNDDLKEAAWCIGTMWIPEGVSVIFDDPEITGDEPTTESPTVEPTTEEPSTEAPTVEPSTEAPTVEPTTEAPTQEPTTQAPTQEPTTQAPTQKPTQAPTVKPTVPQPIPVIKVPDKAKVKKAVKKKKSAKKIKVKIKKVKGAKGYQVYVSKKKKGKALVKKYVKKTKFTIKSKKFKKKKKLYVKVRAYVLDGTTKVFGAWSKPKKTKKK